MTLCPFALLSWYTSSSLIQPEQLPHWHTVTSQIPRLYISSLNNQYLFKMSPLKPVIVIFYIWCCCFMMGLFSPSASFLQTNEGSWRANTSLMVRTHPLSLQYIKIRHPPKAQLNFEEDCLVSTTVWTKRTPAQLTFRRPEGL